MANDVHRRRLTIVRWFLALAAIPLTVILVFALAPRPDHKVIWLSTAQFDATTRTDIFTITKNKLKGLTAPLWRRFYKPKNKPLPFVRLNCSLWLSSSNAAPYQTGLDLPLASNTNGVRAWVLSPPEAAALEKQLDPVDNGTWGRVWPMLIPEGSHATTYFATSQPPPGGPGSPPPNNLPGIRLELSPKLNSASFQLLVRAQAFRAARPPANQYLIATTNFLMACRVYLPTNGALVIDCNDEAVPAGKNHWLIISADAY